MRAGRSALLKQIPATGASAPSDRCCQLIDGVDLEVVQGRAMLEEKVLLKGLIIGLVLLTPTLAATQAVGCQPLSDDETKKLITEPSQVLVMGSGVQCKAGETMIQTRFQVIDHTARYDSETRAKGEKPYCSRLS
jgi:hypothetical protein